MDTCANEAIPQWGKRRLITFVYLQNMSMVMKQCCGYLPFCPWKAVVSNLHGTIIIMNLAQNVLYVLSKCVCVRVCACAAQCKEINDATRRRRGDGDDTTNTTRTQVQPQTLIINGNPSLRIREKEENSHTSSTSPKQERGPPLAVAFQMNCFWDPLKAV